MSKQRDEFVAAKIAKMSLLEKCGQLLTFTWRGAYLTPSGIEQVTKLHAGGLCLEPYALEIGDVHRSIPTLKNPRTILISHIPITTPAHLA